MPIAAANPPARPTMRRTYTPGHGAIGVRSHVSQPEIARNQRVNQNARCRGQQQEIGINGALGAKDQEGIRFPFPATLATTA